MFITPDIIIPLPEAKDYIEKKEIKQKEAKKASYRSSFSLEVGTFSLPELEQKIIKTLARQTDLTPRFVKFLEILLSAERAFGREEIKQQLFQKNVGSDTGQAGRYLSNISQFLTKKSNPHLRQVVTFGTGGGSGEMKDNYQIVTDYRKLVTRLVDEWVQANEESDIPTKTSPPGIPAAE